MADLAYDIHTIETALVMTPSPVALQAPGTSSRDDAQGSYQAVFGEVSETRVVRPFARRRRTTLAAVIAASLLGAFGMFRLGRSLRGSPAPAPEPVATTVLPAVPQPPLPAPALALDSAGEVAAAAAPETGKEPEPSVENPESSKREASPRGRPAPAPPVAAAKVNEEVLREAQQLLHAQRYDDARAAFGKLLAAKQSRGAASAGLAKIAFQEKNYKEAVERAKDSARSGGGAEARVLLGDAYFKLERFEEAKKAYSDALKLDPNNRVAGQGLRLVEGQ
jgi:tetratricopeptide (TPR) repeat protein